MGHFLTMSQTQLLLWTVSNHVPTVMKFLFFLTNLSFYPFLSKTLSLPPYQPLEVSFWKTGEWRGCKARIKAKKSRVTSKDTVMVSSATQQWQEERESITKEDVIKGLAFFNHSPSNIGMIYSNF